MWQNQTSKSSFSDSIKTLEADIQHANTLSAALPRDYCGNYVQMRLSYSPFAPLFLFLIEWMDYSCTDTVPSYLGLLHVLIYKVYGDGMLPSMSSQERKATLREFYVCSNHISFTWATPRRLNWTRQRKFENKDGRRSKQTTRSRERRWMRYMHGNLYQNGLTLLRPFHVYQLLPWLELEIGVLPFLPRQPQEGEL